MEATVAPDDADMGTVNKDLSGSSGTSCPGSSGTDCGCGTGPCCEDTSCFIYYELWWFWMLWTVLIVLSCCCVLRHRQVKLRLQQRRQREIELMVYQRACRYTPPHLQISYLGPTKLPSYEEAAAELRAPPPPYSAVFVLQGGALLSSRSSGTFSSSSSESSSLFSSSAPTDDLLTSSATTPSDSVPCLAPPPIAEETNPEQSVCGTTLLPHPQEVESILHKEGGAEERARAPPSAGRHAAFSSSVSVLEIEGRGSEEDLKENRFRMRTLTGDSGIEVCRCRVIQEEEEDEEEEEGREVGGAWPIHDSVDCPRRTFSDQSELSAVGCSHCGSAYCKQRGGDSSVTVESL
ncbi:WW domain-binding protein 1 [Astyanax mexicanus]|uniref:WW domain-binding protein 1 n=1 Tax=Astyanax mexicanus TaxID=7994 RepID=UPI0020CB281F|nr:WW domain-binding protein 1 [Astyanax mexicanus]